MAFHKFDDFIIRIRGAIGKGTDTSESTSRRGRDMNKPPNSLERELRGWQIYMIAVSGIIGVTILATNGEYLRTAGPAGLLVSIAFVGITAICVMEGLSEMIVLWPVSNAMVEYVRSFVDRDLAIVVGIAYWYTWSSVIATMFIAAAEFAAYWGLVKTWQITIFYFVCPATIVAINWLGVKWYGWVEGIAGILKLIWVLGGAFFLFGVGAKYGSSNINAGFHEDLTVAKNHATAVMLVIPFLAYGFLGVEIVSVTAFEARNPRESLRNPSKFIAYLIVGLFFLCGIGETLNLPWNSPGLPEMADSRLRRDIGTNGNTGSLKATSSVLVLAAERASDKGLASLFNACLIYSCLSAANTALYVSSRTLYGLCREMDQDHPRMLYRVVAKLGALDPRTRVPIWAIIISAAAFFWIPFLHVWNRNSVADLITILTTTGSIGGVLVWASQCLAYIRYHYWCRVHQKTIRDMRELNPKYARYDRWDLSNKQHYFSICGPMQPIPAFWGLIACFLIVFVFSTATWWNGDITAKKVAVAFAGPFVLLFIWVNLKIWHTSREWWVKLDNKPVTFFAVIDNLERLTYLRDEEEDENELSHIRITADAETGDQAAGTSLLNPAGTLDIPGIGTHLPSPVSPSPNRGNSQPSHWQDIGIGGGRRRNTDESNEDAYSGH